MAALTRETEQHVSAPADKVFKALTSGNDALVQIFPQAIQSIETLQGNGGPGTIKKINFAGSEHGYVKNKIDAIDQNNFTFSYTAFEGQPWIDGIDKISFEFKVVPSGGGSVLKIVSKYHTKGVLRSANDPSQINGIDQKLSGIAKAFEAHIVAN